MNLIFLKHTNTFHKDSEISYEFLLTNYLKVKVCKMWRLGLGKKNTLSIGLFSTIEGGRVPYKTRRTLYPLTNLDKSGSISRFWVKSDKKDIFKQIIKALDWFGNISK